MPLKNWIKKLIPDYAAKPLLLAVAANFIIYVGVSQIREYLTFRSLALPVDDRIPFFAPFIIFYILAYVQWIANYLLIAREGKDFCYSGSPGSYRKRYLRAASAADLSDGCTGEPLPVHTLSGELVLYSRSFLHEKNTTLVSATYHYNVSVCLCFHSSGEAACLHRYLWRHPDI